MPRHQFSPPLFARPFCLFSSLSTPALYTFFLEPFVLSPFTPKLDILRSKPSIVQKNPRAHKNKIGTPPPPPKAPPPKKGEFYGHGFSCRKNAFFPGVHKIGAPISGPRSTADTNFTDTKRIFLPPIVGVYPEKRGILFLRSDLGL